MDLKIKDIFLHVFKGMLEPTSGSIFVNGFDTRIDMEGIRNHMGLCPQHNLLFPDLTVEEHLVLFAMVSIIRYLHFS